MFASMACELAAKVFLLQQERGRSVRKDVVIAYYQLFFTDNVTQMAREGWLRQVRHPRELFRSMDLDFLDHCMTCVCRTLTELGRTALKAYRLLVPKRDSGAEPPLPLPTRRVSNLCGSGLGEGGHHPQHRPPPAELQENNGYGHPDKRLLAEEEVTHGGAVRLVF